MAKKFLFVLSILAINLGLVAFAVPAHAAGGLGFGMGDNYGYTPGPYFYDRTQTIRTPCSTSINNVHYPLHYFPTWNFAGTGCGGGSCGGGCGGGCGGCGGVGIY